MADSPRILHLYTHYFPQEGYESFLIPELPYLAKAFDQVKIFPKVDVGKKCIETPSNVEVIYLETVDQKAGLLDRVKVMGANLFDQEYLKRAKAEFTLVGQTLKRVKKLTAYLETNPEAIHYSYWFEEWSIILGELFKKGRISGHVTRAHGFDLYDERSSFGYHPYRKTQSQGLKKIFPVSSVGAEYLKSRIKDIPISTAYLGTIDHGLSVLPIGSAVRIVSIARAVPLKRLHDIVRVLGLCKIQVHWTHIGDGPGLKSLEEATTRLPKNVKVEFMGKMMHGEVMEFFKEIPFHLFISLSESEGLPVSMMEAISFGIPILSTDVGGVKEIVTKETGVLVEPSINHEDIASIIDDWKLTGLSSEIFRQGVRRFWEENFSAATNYPAFIKELKDLHCD